MSELHSDTSLAQLVEPHIEPEGRGLPRLPDSHLIELCTPVDSEPDMRHKASPRTVTPVAALTRGMLAGAAGTLAMDLLLFGRYRREGGKERLASWESSAGLSSWDNAPAPAQLGRRIVEGAFDRKLPAQRARLVNNVTHWAYGILSGAAYGVLAGSLRNPHVRYGLPFGAGVWLAGYVVLPAAGLYKPIWEYDAGTLAKDLSAHLVYGVTTAAAYAALQPSRQGTADQ